MMGRTHMATGALAGAAIVALTQPDPATAAGFIAVCTYSALVPDFDHPSSKVSRALPIVGPLIARLVARAAGGHRGLTHSLLGLAILAAALLPAAALLGLPAWLPYAVLVGCATHIAGDAATETGVPLLYPRRWRFRYASINTGSRVETLIVLPAVVAATVWLASRSVGLL